MIRQLKSIVWWLRRLIGITPASANHEFHKKRSTTLINDYFNKNALRKIQIGAQSNSIADWLNVDLMPKSVDVVYLDATKPFPFPTESIDYIYTEHMLEHISLKDGQFMMSECFRVLRKSGRIRVATPNLAFLVELYNTDKTLTQKNYINFSVERYLKNNTPQEDVYVINNFFRDWGHQFIHDFKSLSFLLSAAGFYNIEQRDLQKSDNIHLQNLEQHGKEIGHEFNGLETIIVEAEKP